MLGYSTATESVCLGWTVGTGSSTATITDLADSGCSSNDYSTTHGSLNPSNTVSHVFTSYWPSSASASFSYDYGAVNKLTTSIPSTAMPLGLYSYARSGSTPGSMGVTWLRLRTYSSNGIMPAASLGAPVVVSTRPMVTLSASSPVLDAGQYQLLTASVIGGTGPYTYDYIVYNALTQSQVNNALWSSPMTTNSFAFQVGTADTFNSPESANILVTDANLNTSSAVLAANFVINPALAGVTLSSAPLLPSSLDVGQQLVFTSGWSGGTNTISANYIISNSLTNNVVASVLYTGLIDQTGASMPGPGPYPHRRSAMRWRRTW